MRRLSLGVFYLTLTLALGLFMVVSGTTAAWGQPAAPAYWFNHATPKPGGAYFPVLPGYPVHYQGGIATVAALDVQAGEQDHTARVELRSAGGAISRAKLTARAEMLPKMILETFRPTIPAFHLWSWQMFLWLTQPAGGKLRFTTMASGDDLMAGVPLEESATASGRTKVKLRTAKDDEIIHVAQAGSDGILVDQLGQAVYYAVHVNRTFAEFIQSIRPTILDVSPELTFPVDSLELKSSWRVARIEGTPVSYSARWTGRTRTFDDIDRYVTIESTIRPLKKMTARLADGTRRHYWAESETTAAVTLALVGMHVVGVVNGHPEMIWATFEHVDNAPDAGDFGALGEYIQTSDRIWSFHDGKAPMAEGNSSFNSTPSFDEPRPTSVFRVHPWGGQRYCTQANGRDIRAINASVRAQLEASELPHKSVLANYQLIGSVWIGSASDLPAVADPPVVGRDRDCSNGHYEKVTVPESGANLAGSVLLANTTMETFTQGMGCFACHNGGFPDTEPPSSLKLSISHLFRDLYTHASRVPRAK